MYVFMYVCMHVCMFVCMYVLVYVYIYIYVSLYVHCWDHMRTKFIERHIGSHELLGLKSSAVRARFERGLSVN